MRTLKLGEVASDIPVVAKAKWNPTGLLVEPGQRYLVTASTDLWMDRDIPSTAAGQPGVGAQKLFLPLKRCRAAQWFQLVAAVGRSHSQLFPIGMEGKVSLVLGDSGELYLFANDVSFAYFNNAGSITVDVCREQ